MERERDKRGEVKQPVELCTTPFLSEPIWTAQALHVNPYSPIDFVLLI